MSSILKRVVISSAAVLMLSTMFTAAEERTGSVKALIDRDCVPHCGTFTVAASTVARNFRMAGLDPGVNCATGATIGMRSFQIENIRTGETVYRFTYQIDRDVIEIPVKLGQLSLGAGSYRLCVGGGRNAFCALEYDIAAAPGEVSSPAPKPRPSKKLPPAAPPSAKSAIKDELWRDGVGIIQALENLEPQVEDAEEFVGSVSSLEALDQARSLLQSLESEARSQSGNLDELKRRAASHGIDVKELEELLEEDWAKLEARPRKLLNDLRSQEDHLDAVEKALRQQREREEEADPTRVEIKKWLKYAADFSQKNGIIVDTGKLQAEMEINVLQSVTPQATFYQHLFSRYVQCLVAGAQKRSKCKVSGSVTALKVETAVRRVTYEYMITEECPNITYRNPGRGATTFDQLEQWVRDSCR